MDDFQNITERGWVPKTNTSFNQKEKKIEHKTLRT